MMLSVDLSNTRTFYGAHRVLTFSPRSSRRFGGAVDAIKGSPYSFSKRRIGVRQSTHYRHKPRRFLPTIFAEYTRLPFNQDDYKRVRVHSVKPISSAPPHGTLLLVEDKYDISDEEVDSRGLVLHVGGDTLTAIAFTVSDREPERPMTVNLIYNILEHCREMQPLEWHLLHVAIVDLRDDVFIGRLFFGNPETGEILWDCDCRPSDACWLSLKRMCPLYVRHSVWETCAQSLAKMYANRLDLRSSLENLGFLGDPAASSSPDTADPLTSIRPNDPMAIKRLKREMAVAVTEEDYSTAARIRDHPYMRAYKSIFDLRKEGKHEEASHIEQELRQQIERDEAAEDKDA